MKKIFKYKNEIFLQRKIKISRVNNKMNLYREKKIHKKILKCFKKKDAFMYSICREKKKYNE
jgi:hypothetical protein